MIGLKSTRIARDVVELLRQEEMKDLQETFYTFKRIPYGDSLAARIFEAMVHRKFRGGWQLQPDGPTLSYIRMYSTNTDPPIFSTKPFTLPADESPPPAPLSATGKRISELILLVMVPTV